MNRSTFYPDMARYMQMSDEQLNFVLAALCRYVESDGYLVEMMVDHVIRIEHGRCRAIKKPFFESCVQLFPWLEAYNQPIKAVVLASYKHNEWIRPETQMKSMLEHFNELSTDTLERHIEAHSDLTFERAS